MVLIPQNPRSSAAFTRREASIRMGPRARGAAGLTMVELLVTASIVAVSLLAISMIFPVASSNIDVGGDETAATTIGVGFTELVRNVDWNTLLAFNGLDSKSATPCAKLSGQVAAACQSWITQLKQLDAGQATVTVQTIPGLNPMNTQQLAVVTVAVSYNPRLAWLPSFSRRQAVFVTRRTQ